jgi:hypothetical protein
VPSLRLDVATRHVHRLRTTHALLLREYWPNAPITHTVCYYASYLGKGM